MQGLQGLDPPPHSQLPLWPPQFPTTTLRPSPPLPQHPHERSLKRPRELPTFPWSHDFVDGLATPQGWRWGGEARLCVHGQTPFRGPALRPSTRASTSTRTEGWTGPAAQSAGRGRQPGTCQGLWPRTFSPPSWHPRHQGPTPGRDPPRGGIFRKRG